MASKEPLKIPLFRLASGRTQVDDRLGISLQKLAPRVPFRHIPHRYDLLPRKTQRDAALWAGCERIEGRGYVNRDETFSGAACFHAFRRDQR
jgi:hypothetical protein